MLGSEYKGEALIVRVEPQKEGDAVVTLFTKEQGLIKAKVVSMRTMRSRLRAHLLRGSLAEISLVEGVDFYRLKGAVDDPVSRLIIKSPVSLVVLGQVLTLLEKHLHGPEPYPELYLAIKELLTVLQALATEEEKEQWVTRLVGAFQLVLLKELGYTPKLDFWPSNGEVNYKEIVRQLLPLANLKSAQAYCREAFVNLP